MAEELAEALGGAVLELPFFSRGVASCFASGDAHAALRVEVGLAGLPGGVADPGLLLGVEVGGIDGGARERRRLVELRLLEAGLGD